MTGRSVLPDDHPVRTWDHLVMALGGAPTSFTGQLLTLLAKADPGNRERLRQGFPVEVAAWEIWHLAREPLTVAQLYAIVTAYAEEEITR